MASGAGFLYYACKLMFRPKASTPMDTFRFSIIYLAIVFVALVIDHYLV
jgi:protoheme IX farnesyltransferase